MKTQDEEYNRINVILMGRREHSGGGRSIQGEEEAYKGRRKQSRRGGSRAGKAQPQQSVFENAKWNSLLCVTILKYIYNDIELAVSWVIPTHSPKKPKEKKKIRQTFIC